MFDDDQIMSSLINGPENEPPEAKANREELLKKHGLLEDDKSEQDSGQNSEQNQEQNSDQGSDQVVDDSDKTENEVEQKDDVQTEDNIELSVDGSDNTQNESGENKADEKSETKDEKIELLNFISNIGTKERKTPEKIDYTGVEEVNAEQLEKDRETYAKATAEETLYYEQQKHFFDSIKTDVEIVSSDPTLSVIVAEKDGQPNPDYNPTMHQLVDSVFAGVAGIRQFNYTDADGQNKTGTEAIRTDIKYKDFAKNTVKAINHIVDSRVAKEVEARVEAIKKQGGVSIKPTSSSSVNKRPALTPELIRNMSADEYEKRRDEINRFIGGIL